MAAACDKVIITSLAEYLYFPQAWERDSTGAFLRAQAMLRAPFREGGFAYTAAQAIMHPAFYAAMAQSLSDLSTSSLRDLLPGGQLPQPLSATTTGASHQPLLKGFQDCFTEFVQLGCNIGGAQHTQGSEGADKAPTLPTLDLLFPPRDDSTQSSTQTGTPPIPAQRTLSKYKITHDPRWTADNMYKGGTAQDKERVDSLKRYTVKADSSAANIGSFYLYCIGSSSSHGLGSGCVLLFVCCAFL